jgi:hypothetical protein
MQFQPKSEEQLAKEKAEQDEKRLMKYGTVCDCEVVNAEDKTSNAGNPMIKLGLRVWNPDGEEKFYDDYILAEFEFKLRHAADTFGLIEKYNTGNLSAVDFQGRTGKCKMGIKRDKTGQYPDKNVIADYVKRDASATVEVSAPAKTVSAQQLDDEIPF